MNHQAVEEAAAIIWATWLANSRIASLPQSCRPGSRTEAYSVQAQVARLSAQRTFGWKIAATSQAGQRHIGVNGPLAGRLLEKRVFPSGTSVVPLTNNIMNVVEAEFAFRLARDLPPRPTPYGVAEVVAAVDTMHPAIEIPDSRYEDFVSVGAEQLIADNACAGYFVLGPATSAAWRAHDLPGHTTVLSVNGRKVQEGKGANVLGDPRIALTWIANELASTDAFLRTGQVITTGTCIVPATVAPGDRVVADFGIFGMAETQLGS